MSASQTVSFTKITNIFRYQSLSDRRIILEKTTLTNLAETKNGFYEGEAKNSESEWVDDKYHGHGTSGQLVSSSSVHGLVTRS